MRGSRRALVVVDLPFGSYEESPAAAFRTAARVMKETGCGAVKLEGGAAHGRDRPLPRRARHPGHGPCRPDAAVLQHASAASRCRGATRRAPPRSSADAMAVAEAGAFAIVLEGVVEPLGPRDHRLVAVPTIGIGASPACDGQILVLEDMLGLSPRVPKFVKRYGSLAGHIEEAVRAYAEEVRARAFPGERQRLQAEGLSGPVRSGRLQGPGPVYIWCRPDRARSGVRPGRSRMRQHVRYLSRSRRGPPPRTVQAALGPLRHLCHRPRDPDRRRDRRLAALGILAGRAGRRRPATVSSPRSSSPTRASTTRRSRRSSAIAADGSGGYPSSPASARRREGGGRRRQGRRRRVRRDRRGAARRPALVRDLARLRAALSSPIPPASPTSRPASATSPRPAIPGATAPAKSSASPPGGPATSPTARKYFDEIVADQEKPADLQSRAQFMLA